MPQPGPRSTAPTKQFLRDPSRREELRKRIVSAATTLAVLGDGECQIRSVATAAGIAPSTVYRYFTSKDDLLLACLHRWVSDFSASMDASIDGSDFRRGNLEVARMLTVSLCASPRFTEAVIRPYLYAHGEASALADIVRQQLIEIFCTALHDRRPSQLHGSVAEVLTDIWVTNVVAVSQQRATLDDVMHRLSLVVNALWDNANEVNPGAARPDSGEDAVA